MTPLPADALPPSIRARFIDAVNGQRTHVLEAGFETPGRPCVLLLHGFPELAYSWRQIMPPLAASGFHVIAPDQRGYGHTTPDPVDYDDDLSPFAIPNTTAVPAPCGSATAPTVPGLGALAVCALAPLVRS